MLLNHYGKVSGVPSLGADLHQGARLAVEHLASHGHTRIGLVSGTTSDERRDARHTGWFDTVHDLGLAHGPVLTVGFSIEAGYEAGRVLASSPDLPSAIFATSDRQAVGLIHAFHEAGIRIPEDVAVIGFDGGKEGAYTWPPLTSVAQPLKKMAQVAVTKLLDDPPGATHQLFETSLLVRRSCGC